MYLNDVPIERKQGARRPFPGFMCIMCGPGPPDAPPSTPARAVCWRAREKSLLRRCGWCGPGTGRLIRFPDPASASIPILDVRAFYARQKKKRLRRLGGGLSGVPMAVPQRRIHAQNPKRFRRPLSPVGLRLPPIRTRDEQNRLEVALREERDRLLLRLQQRPLPVSSLFSVDGPLSNGRLSADVPTPDLGASLTLPHPALKGVAQDQARPFFLLGGHQVAVGPPLRHVQGGMLRADSDGNPLGPLWARRAHSATQHERSTLYAAIL